ncbi:MAG: sigma-54-dependent transcriptional regulator, partial [Isosphaeraceae bacterium]
MADILLIDDDPALIPRQVRLAFPAHTHCVLVARTGAEGLARVRTDLPDVILLDLRLPDQSGLEIYQAIRQVDGRIPVIFITLARSADSAIEAMRQGAYDYLFKPLDLQELRRVVNEALEVGRRMRRPAAVAETPPDPDFPGAIVGTCPAMREVYKSIGRVAAQNLPVLITGESGTGKELVARAIYQHGPRARAPYRTLNCAAIPESLLESELFGHERGAFTGADRKRIGKFEQCNGGTLFLDEVGDMAESVQAKMLRLLQEQEFERVGGNELVRTDVRLIGATHRDLKAWSAEGKFRPDLYYRLSVVTIHLPPLRDRGDDLSLLVQLFLRRYNIELGREVREVAPEVMNRFRSYPWPGNVRELQSVLQQALLRASGTVLISEFLPNDLLPETQTSAASDPGTRYRPGSTLADLEREAIQQCLLQTG